MKSDEINSVGKYKKKKYILNLGWGGVSVGIEKFEVGIKVEIFRFL